jgi:alkanesulfonate monooxygenase
VATDDAADDAAAAATLRRVNKVPAPRAVIPNRTRRCDTRCPFRSVNVPSGVLTITPQADASRQWVARLATGLLPTNLGFRHGTGSKSDGLPNGIGGLGSVSTPASGPMEISWFAALCDDDYEVLGVPDPALSSSFEHCADIVAEAERWGYDNILLPSGYLLGIDALAFAAAVAPSTERIRLLVAVRGGEQWPPQLARQLATLDHLLEGRLTVNIISSDLPGESIDAGTRYSRTLEVMGILRMILDGKRVDHAGIHFDLQVDPPRLGTVSGRCPLLYFGGLSEPARNVAAQAADIYLLWPDTEEEVAALLADMRSRAAVHGRTLRFGYRSHVVVRPSEEEARAAARQLVSALDPADGAAIRSRSLDANSSGVARQAELRDDADADGYVEPHLWTGIGRARSGCGAAIVGDPIQVATKLERYMDMGIEAFVLSGYPHLDECRRFGRSVLPLLDHAPLDV